jgi:hypothetical protein
MLNATFKLFVKKESCYHGTTISDISKATKLTGGGFISILRINMIF